MNIYLILQSLNKHVTYSETTDAKHPQNLEKNRSSIVPCKFICQI